MAWRFRVIAISPTGDAVTVRVRYCDDATPSVALGRALLRLPANTTRPQARDAIIAEGQRQRAAYAARDRLFEDIGAEGAVT
jgi:hypothetical protein